MKLTKWLLGLFVLFIVGGFIYLAAIDVPVEQNQVTKTIPNERFFSAS